MFAFFISVVEDNLAVEIAAKCSLGSCNHAFVLLRVRTQISRFCLMQVFSVDIAVEMSLAC
jgi:hypothetical protein